MTGNLTGRHIFFTGWRRNGMLVRPSVCVCLCVCVLQRWSPGSHRACRSRRRWRPRRSSARRRKSRTAGCRSRPGRDAPSRCKSLWPGTAQALGDTKHGTVHLETRPLNYYRSSAWFWFNVALKTIFTTKSDNLLCQNCNPRKAKQQKVCYMIWQKNMPVFIYPCLLIRIFLHLT